MNALLLFTVLAQYAPVDDHRPSGNGMGTGCATWSNGSTLCCSSANVCQLIGKLQTGVVDSISGDLAVGNVNAANIKIGATATPVVVTSAGAVTIPSTLSAASATFATTDPTARPLKVCDSTVAQCIGEDVSLTGGMSVAGVGASGNTATIPLVVKAQNASPTATSNTTGANTMVGGGLGTKGVTFVAGDSVCPTANGGGATTIATTTDLGTVTATYGTDFCIGSVCSTPTLAAANYASWLSAKGGAVAGVTAVNVAGVVQITLPKTMVSYSQVFSGAACGSKSDGTDGQVLVPSGAYLKNGIAVLQYPTSGISYINGNEWDLNILGARACSIIAAAGKCVSFLAETNVQLYGSAMDGTTGVLIDTLKNARNKFTEKIAPIATFTFAAGGEASKTWVGGIPKGATGVQCTGWNTVAESGGGCTSYKAGNGTVSPLDNRWGATLPLTLDASWSPAHGDSTAGSFDCYGGTDCDITLTSVGGGAACKNLVVRVTCSYSILSADTVH